MGYDFPKNDMTRRYVDTYVDIWIETRDYAECILERSWPSRVHQHGAGQGPKSRGYERSADRSNDLNEEDKCLMRANHSIEQRSVRTGAIAEPALRRADAQYAARKAHHTFGNRVSIPATPNVDAVARA